MASIQHSETAAVESSGRTRFLLSLAVRTLVSLVAIAVARELADLLIGIAPTYERAINTVAIIGLAALVPALFWPAFTKKSGGNGPS